MKVRSRLLAFGGGPLPVLNTTTTTASTFHLQLHTHHLFVELEVSTGHTRRTVGHYSVNSRFLVSQNPFLLIVLNCNLYGWGSLFFSHLGLTLFCLSLARQINQALWVTFKWSAGQRAAWGKLVHRPVQFF